MTQTVKNLAVQTLSELGEFFSVSEASIRRWRDKGCPLITDKSGHYLVSPVARWRDADLYCDFLQKLSGRLNPQAAKVLEEIEEQLMHLTLETIKHEFQKPKSRKRA